MRILIISQWFEPEPFLKGLGFVKELQMYGHEVEVLTGFPNFPGGRIYPGYSLRFFQREYIDSIRINRVALFPSHNNSGFLRIINYTSFLLFGSIIGPFVISKPDIVYVYNLPTAGLIANILRFFFQAKFVLDIQDLWPESVTRSGMMDNRLLNKVLNWFSNKIYKSADHLTVLSPGFMNELEKRKIDRKKISIIYNWCSETIGLNTSEKKTENSILPKFDGKFNVVYAGTMGKMQALDSVIEAAVLISKTDYKIQFWLIGDGIEVNNLKSLVQAYAIVNVTFVPRLNENEISEVMKRADLLLVHLKNDPLFEITIPSKIQAYMFSCKPILVGVKGDAAKLVEDAEAGITCEPENPISIAEAIVRFSQLEPLVRQKFAENGKKYYQENLSRRIGVKCFSDIFNALVE